MKIVKWGLRLLPVAYMGLIWILSSLPHNAVVELPDSATDRFIKESLHLVEFGILYCLLVGAWLITGKFTLKISYVLALIAAAYGALDEIHQSFVPYRSATLIDFAKDVIGVLVSYWIVKWGYFNSGSKLMIKSFQSLMSLHKK